MIDRAGISGLVPHALGMCLLDAVESWDDLSIRCVSLSHCDARNPLRSGGRLAALNLCEYGAQAMAVHGGLLARRATGAKAAHGMLVSLREVELTIDRIDDIPLPLVVVAHQKITGAAGWLYEFEITAGKRLLARGRTSVISTQKPA